MGLGGSYVLVVGVEPRSPACEASTLPDVLSRWPPVLGSCWALLSRSKWPDWHSPHSWLDFSSSRQTEPKRGSLWGGGGHQKGPPDSQSDLYMEGKNLGCRKLESTVGGALGPSCAQKKQHLPFLFERSPATLGSPCYLRISMLFRGTPTTWGPQKS